MCTQAYNSASFSLSGKPVIVGICLVCASFGEGIEYISGETQSEVA